MHTIANMINGDRAICEHEDNYSDLIQAAMNSIRGFKKKTGMSFDEMIEDENFSKYTKTVLWKLKANKGARITKKLDFLNSHVNLSSINFDDKELEIPCRNTTGSIELEFASKKTQDIRKSLLKDPSHIDFLGNIDIARLAEKLNLEEQEVKEAFKEIGI